MLKTKSKSHYLAGVSLTIMSIGFISTIPFQHSLWGGLLQGGFESGLVGGLADWFAVTALFRHPLGIPIPHTALLPKNRQRMTNGIVSMLENEWLTKESIREKIKNMNFTEKSLNFIEKNIHSETVKNAVVSFILNGLSQFDTKMLVGFAEKELKEKLHAINPLPLLQTAVEQVKEKKFDEKAIDYAFKELETWADKESTKQQLGFMAIDYLENMKSDGFMQLALKSFSSFINEEKLGSILQTFILKNVRSLMDHENRNRQMLLLQIQNELSKPENLQKLSAELNGWKQQYLETWEPADKISELLDQLKEKLIGFIEAPYFFDEYILPLALKLVSDTKENTEKMDSIENWIQKQITEMVEKNHSIIGKLVKENLEKLDDKTLITMVENNVGKDLQWIRVNGALCGFLIGLVLVGIKAFF
ncbi:MAG: DUF445 domain-containing protein [Bacillota bacterium]|nr:DUF445 domain-containing protein [Bacillota bacterium]